MWLYEGTESLQVIVEYGGNGNLTTGSLHIVETKQLWTMLYIGNQFVSEEKETGWKSK